MFRIYLKLAPLELNRTNVISVSGLLIAKLQIWIGPADIQVTPFQN